MFGGMKCEDDVGGVPELRGWWWWTLGKAKREGGKESDDGTTLPVREGRTRHKDSVGRTSMGKFA